MDLNALNDHFSPLSPISRIKELYNYFDEEEILFTSSFGTSSIYLLHLIHRIRPNQSVHFLNTLFHFPETINYKKEVSNLLNINVVDIYPEKKDHEEAVSQKLWSKNPNLCCVLNKVLPLQAVKEEHKVWISGLMAYQNGHRKTRKIFEQQGAIIKFHPLIDYTENDFTRYINFFKLPQHPLKAEGYGSIGCHHCTIKGVGRAGRWANTGKTECGLHVATVN